MFDNFFEVILADTEEAREIHYNLRYQVYCEELGYEDVDKFPNKMEFDEWDPKDDDDKRTLLFLVRLKHTNEWIGTMRLVHSYGKKLPLLEAGQLDHSLDASSIEISRLCLLKEIRKPFIQNSYGIDESDTAKNQMALSEEDESVKLFYSNPKVKSTIIWGFFNAVLEYSTLSNIDKCYIFTNRALGRMLKRQGLNLEQVGSTVEHKGKRAPYLISMADTRTKSIWDTFNKGYSLFSELMQPTQQQAVI